MGLGSTIISIGGVIAVAGVAWFLYSKGYFDSIIGAIPDIGGDTDSKPKPEGSGGGTIKCTSKTLCKDGKCESNKTCETIAKCKSGEKWDEKAKKCVKSSNLAYAFVSQQGPFTVYKTFRV